MCIFSREIPRRFILTAFVVFEHPATLHPSVQVARVVPVFETIQQSQVVQLGRQSTYEASNMWLRTAVAIARCQEGSEAFLVIILLHSFLLSRPSFEGASVKSNRQCQDAVKWSLWNEYPGSLFTKVLRGTRFGRGALHPSVYIQQINLHILRLL
jgi:hypothetical protein